jgi:hypothetical protein
MAKWRHVRPPDNWSGRREAGSQWKERGRRGGAWERMEGPRCGGKEMRPGADREVRRNEGKAVPTTVRRKG